MAAGHGGARVGAGRPKGATPSKRSKTEPAPRAEEPKLYEDALQYLEAVVRGEIPADSLRVAAARIVLPYQRPKQRAPMASPPPNLLRVNSAAKVAKDAKDDWERRAAAVKERFAKKEPKP